MLAQSRRFPANVLFYRYPALFHRNLLHKKRKLVRTCSFTKMQTDPQELEKLLQKKKTNTGPFPSIDAIPNKESFQFLINPPIK